MTEIQKNEGLFIAPAPVYESYKTALHNALENHDRKELIYYKNQFNIGFETPIEIEYEEETYTFRMIILYAQYFIFLVPSAFASAFLAPASP